MEVLCTEARSHIMLGLSCRRLENLSKCQNRTRLMGIFATRDFKGTSAISLLGEDIGDCALEGSQWLESKASQFELGCCKGKFMVM